VIFGKCVFTKKRTSLFLLALRLLLFTDGALRMLVFVLHGELVVMVTALTVAIATRLVVGG